MDRLSGVPLGSYLMCFRFLQVAWTFARTGELPHHDHAQVEGLDDETITSRAPQILEACNESGDPTLAARPVSRTAQAAAFSASANRAPHRS